MVPEPFLFLASAVAMRDDRVRAEAMEAALDSEDPKQAFVELLLRHSC